MLNEGDVDDDDNNENYCDTSDSIDNSFRFKAIKEVKRNRYIRDDESDKDDNFDKNLIVSLGGESHQQQNRAGK
jgi:hypothetical protein